MSTPKKIKLDGSVGSSFELVCGDRSLIVKIADDAIIPDFVESATRAIKARPYVLSLAASRVFHREPEAETRLRDVLGDARDVVFSEIKGTEKPSEKASGKVAEKSAESEE